MGRGEVDLQTVQGGQEGAGQSRLGMLTGHLSPLSVLSHSRPRRRAGKHVSSFVRRA